MSEKDDAMILCYFSLANPALQKVRARPFATVPRKMEIVILPTILLRIYYTTDTTWDKQTSRRPFRPDACKKTTMPDCLNARSTEMFCIARRIKMRIFSSRFVFFQVKFPVADTFGDVVAAAVAATETPFRIPVFQIHHRLTMVAVACGGNH